MGSFLDRLLQLPNLIVRTLTDPTANLTATAVLFASIVLIALIGVVILLVIAVRPGGGKKKGAGASTAAKPRKGLTLQERRMLVLGALGALLVVSVAFYAQGSQTTTCLRCHSAKTAPVKSANLGTHRTTRCWDCHGGRGVFGGLSARLQYVRWSIPGRSETPKRRADVPVGNCLACHDDIRTTLIKTDHVRMSHAAPIAAGWPCIRCHRDAGHEGDPSLRERQTFMMSECVVCHDGKKAAAECETCHIDDVGATSGTPPERFPKVEMGPPKTCRGCHEIASCNKCHGVEMPHSDDFVTRGHAMAAAFDKKKVCFKCHSLKTFCNRCHKFKPDGTGWHPADFRSSHRSVGNTCGCHNIQRARDYCILCHGSPMGR